MGETGRNTTNNHEKTTKIKHVPKHESIFTPTFAAAHHTLNDDPHMSQYTQHDWIQRQCGCGRHTIGGGDCEECKKNTTHGQIDDVFEDSTAAVQTFRNQTIHYN